MIISRFCCVLCISLHNLHGDCAAMGFAELQGGLSAALGDPIFTDLFISQPDFPILLNSLLGTCAVMETGRLAVGPQGALQQHREIAGVRFYNVQNLFKPRSRWIVKYIS